MTIEDAWGPGRPEKWRDHGIILLGDERRRECKLIYGEHPHSRSDNRHYAICADESEPIGFSGHRPLVDVNFRSYNYLKDSYYSGSEIRKGGRCDILINDYQCYEFFYRDLNWALIHAHQLIPKILEHPLRYWDLDEAKNLIGRQMFYREISCNIIRLIRDQGCLILARPEFQLFPPPIWSTDSSDAEREIKVNIVEPSDNLWFFAPDPPTASQAPHPAGDNGGSELPPDIASGPTSQEGHSPSAEESQSRSEPGS